VSRCSKCPGLQGREKQKWNISHNFVLDPVIVRRCSRELAVQAALEGSIVHVAVVYLERCYDSLRTSVLHRPQSVMSQKYHQTNSFFVESFLLLSAFFRSPLTYVDVHVQGFGCRKRGAAAARV